MLPKIHVSKKYFDKLDLSKIQSPSFVIDLKIIRENLSVLKKIKTKTGVKILLALKAFSLKKTGVLISKHLDGTCASGLNEAKLGKKFFPGMVSTYSPAFKKDEIEEVLKFSNHIIFNSINQINKFSNQLESNKHISVGIRINPMYSEVKTKKYNTSGYQSRLGIHLNHLKDLNFNNIDGLHFHSLCEQNFSTLERTWAKIFPRIKPYLKNLKWINLGGGHHITRNDYDINGLINFLNDIKLKTKCQIYLEPGEAVVFQSGIIVGEVLDLIKSSNSKTPHIAITDISATCHIPDVIEAPYKPILLNEPLEGKEVMIGGPSCLAGDIFGKYKFKTLPNLGDKIIFLDQAHYSLVKTNFFNGIKHPDIVLWDSQKDTFDIVKSFSYSDFEMRM